MILVIGEILMDMIGNTAKDSLDVVGKLGGAPFNVASDLSDLNVPVCFHGVLGKDVIGDFLSDQLKEAKDNLSLSLSRREDKMTTIAFFLKDKGDFQFLRKAGADYDFKKEELLALPYQKASIIHFGSLFLSDKNARETIFSTIKDYKKEKKLISFDVNFRSDIFKEGEDYISYYNEMISLSDIIKTTTDELEMLTGEKELINGLKKLGEHKIILITDGKNGSYSYYDEHLYFKKSVPIKPVDTIGCGDSFMAGSLSYLYNKDIDSLKEEDIDALLERGNLCGKKTCLVTGALHAYRSINDLEDKYETDR